MPTIFPENTAEQAEVVVSTEDGQLKLAELPDISVGAVEKSNSLTVVIHPERTGQSLLGMGASLEHSTCSNLFKLTQTERERVVESLVSPRQGIGMNLMRLCIGTSDFTGEPYYTYDDMPAGESDPELRHFSIEKDRAYVLPIVRAAKRANKDVLFFASPWSPPAWMKTGGRLGTGRLRKDCYPVFARYLLKFLEAYRAEGIDIHALTVQNEPQHQDIFYPTTLMDAADQRDFLRDHLGPLFEANRVKTKIWCWDHNWNRIDFPRTILSDPGAARYVDGTAFHHYEGSVDAQSQLHREFPDKHIYFSEGSVFGTEGAVRIIDILRHDSRSYNAWVILLDEHRKPNRGPHAASATCIELLDNGTVRVNFDYYMQGQFTKHLRRGAVRLESSTADSKVPNVVFRNPDGTAVLVAANVRAEPMEFDVRCGRRQFTAQIPGRAVATWRWKLRD